MNPPNSSNSLIRSAAESTARRMKKGNRPIPALTSIIELVDNDETDMPLDEIGRVIEYFSIPILRTEYDQLMFAATQLDSMDSLIDVQIDRFIIA
ncbi:hypothetical protein ACLVWQ_28250 [Streptomyces sp. CWNU-52B]|uniref:hypothetical protein n=1 Tax=unclassified Streptomyces TaxID=2593676 RepID=UPI0039C006F8